MDYRKPFNYLFENSQILLIRLEEENDPEAILRDFELLLRETLDRVREADPEVRIGLERMDESERSIMVILDEEPER